MSRPKPPCTDITLGLSLCVIAGVACFAWPFTVDDAYIVANYARQLHAHAHYSLDGVQTSDGVTGPLWLLPFLLGQRLGVSAIDSAKVLGLLCTLLAVAFVLRRLRARRGSLGVVTSAAMLCACQADLAVWSVGGLETGAATLMLTLAALAATAYRPTIRHSVLLGGSVALLAWLRPDLAVASAVLLLCLWTRDRRRGWVAIAFGVLGAISVVTFRLVMFGHVWPLSALAKPAELDNGARYLATGVVLITGVVGMVLFAYGLRFGRRVDRWVGAAVIAHAGALLLAGGDWMPGFRLFVPVIPLYAWVAAVGAARLALQRRVGLSVALVVGSCALPLLSLCVQLPLVRASGVDRELHGAALATWLRAHACHVALVDVGYLVYESEVRVLDLAGITDVSIARLPGGHVNKAIDVALILRRAPDTLVLRGKQHRSIEAGLPLDVTWHSTVERRLARAPQIQSRYRPVHVQPYAAGYVYYVLQRDSAQSCSRR